jgi:hypothetical protein
MHIIFFVYNNQSRASSPTRTVFRLNTNQSHAYEDPLYIKLELVIQSNIYRNQTYCTH